MASKGFNSILIDFDSIIDMDISYIKFLKNEYKDINVSDMDMNRIRTTRIRKFEIDRMYGVETLFKSLLSENFKSESENIFSKLMDRDYEEVLNKYYHFTNMKNLINAYKKAGDGVIKTTIFCENEIQYNFIKKRFQNTPIEMGDRSKIIMSKYTRLISGNYKNILKYKLNEPKSVLILNYRDNFTNNDIKLLHPELVIRLGDIHNIEVISAYKNDFEIYG